MKTIPLVLSVIIFIVGPVFASPVQWAGNNHWYDLVYLDPVLDWEDAREMAENDGGYLVTLINEDENDFVWNFLKTATNLNDTGYEAYWLGGYQTSYDNEPDGDWAWVTGEEWAYTNWLPDEPNNGRDGTQHYLHYWGTDSGEFDDMENGRYMAGYVVEFDSEPIPEPAISLLLVSGLILLIGIKRKDLPKNFF